MATIDRISTCIRLFVQLGAIVRKYRNVEVAGQIIQECHQLFVQQLQQCFHPYRWQVSCETPPFDRSGQMELSKMRLRMNRGFVSLAM